MRDAAGWAPEGKAIVEGSIKLILELHCPCGAAVRGLVDAEIGRVISDGLQIGDAVANALDIAELQRFGARNDTRSPVAAAICGDDESAAAPGGPHDALVDRTDGDKALRGIAVLRSEFRLANVAFCEGQCRECEKRDQLSGRRAIQHEYLSGRSLAGGAAV